GEWEKQLLMAKRPDLFAREVGKEGEIFSEIELPQTSGVQSFTYYGEEAQEELAQEWYRWTLEASYALSYVDTIRVEIDSSLTRPYVVRKFMGRVTFCFRSDIDPDYFK